MYLEADPNPRRFHRAGKWLLLSVCACFLTLFATQSANAQIAIETESKGVTTGGRQLSLTWTHTSSSGGNRLLIVVVGAGKQAGILAPIDVEYDYLDATNNGNELALTRWRTEYEGANDNALRGVQIFYRFLGSDTFTTGAYTMRATTTNDLHMGGYAFTLTGAYVAGGIPFSHIAKDIVANDSTPNALIPNAVSWGADGLILDVMVCEPKGANEITDTCTAATPAEPTKEWEVRRQVSSASGGQDFWSTVGIIYDPTGTSMNTGYTYAGTNAFTLISFAITPANASPVRMDSMEADYYPPSFTGPRAGQSGNLVRWRTGAESENLGYHVYRERNGERTRITREVIAGSALMAGRIHEAGYSYAWWDAQGIATDTYWIEEVSVDGKLAMHGPVQPVANQNSAGAPAFHASRTLNNLELPATQTSSLINPANVPIPGFLGNKAGTTGGGGTPKGALATQWALAARGGVKVLVDSTGWQRITSADLAAAGLNLGGADPRFLQLYVDGAEVAMTVNGQEDGRFDAEDSIEFFGSGVDAPTTDTRVYYLTEGQNAGRRIKSNGSGVPQGVGLSFPATVELKESLLYLGNVVNGDADNFFGRPLFFNAPLNQTLNLGNVDPAGTTATVEVAARSLVPGAHLISVALNGQDLGLLEETDAYRATGRFTVPHSMLVEGNNTVSLTRGSSITHVVEYIRISYQHQATADQNELVLVGGGRTPAFTVDGFTNPNVRVVDVTRPSDVVEHGVTVAADGDTYTATFAAIGPSSKKFYAFASDRVRTPALERNHASTLNSTANQADLVIISHRDFASEALRLKEFRESQGYRVALTDIEDVYDEFSFGYHTPIAIQGFLTRAKTAWNVKPRYVLYVGDATLDPRNFIGSGFADYVPTTLVDRPDFQAASDDVVADVNGDSIPDLAVGRLPVRTLAEAQTIVDKIIAYESTPSGGMGEVLMVADQNDLANNMNFEAGSQQIQNLLTGNFHATQVYRGVVGTTAARAQVLSGIQNGAGLVHYSGHGSPTIWAGGLLMAEDAPNLGNARPAVFTIGNCLNGYVHAFVGDSLAEALLKTPTGGAVVVWAASGTTQASAQQRMLEQFYRQQFSGGNQTLGDSALRAKATADATVRDTWIFFGDPTTRLKY